MEEANKLRWNVLHKLYLSTASQLILPLMVTAFIRTDLLLCDIYPGIRVSFTRAFYQTVLGIGIYHLVTKTKVCTSLDALFCVILGMICSASKILHILAELLVVTASAVIGPILYGLYASRRRENLTYYVPILASGSFALITWGTAEMIWNEYPIKYTVFILIAVLVVSVIIAIDATDSALGFDEIISSSRENFIPLARAAFYRKYMLGACLSIVVIDKFSE